MSRTQLRVLNVLPDPRLGGPHVRVSLLAAELPAHGIETVVAMPDGPASAYFRSMGIKHVPVEFARISRRGVARSAGRYVSRILPDVFRVADVIERLSMDAVHVNGAMTIVGPLAGAVSRRSVVWHMNDVSVPPTLYRSILMSLGHLADVIVYSSDAVRIHSGGMPDVREEIIPPPIDTSRFRPGAVVDGPAAIRARHDLDDHTPLLVTVGNINQAKGHIHLAEAVEILVEQGTSLHLLIVGLAAHEDLARDLRRYIKQCHLDDCITITGPRSDVESYLAAATVFVLPSVREAMPISLLEAMAAGRPCIASCVGGVPEVVRDGENGLLVPPADAAALADAIQRLLSNASLCTSLGRRAAESVGTRYDKGTIARQWAGLYRSICA